MRKYSALQKVMALALTLVLVIGLMPNIALPAAAAEGQATLTYIDKVADPETLNNWQDYYGDNSLLPDGSRGTSTWKAGGVWTDKSVFEDGASFTAAADTTASVSVGENNFLVSLSALASNTEVVGQSTAPTDTMLVLDVSGSMDSNDKAEAMVEAANRAIDALLKQNKNNRVGVMLYSGTRNDDGATATTLLLPLDHYTTTSTVTTGNWYNRETIPAYLNITDSNNSPDVYIASGVRNSNGQAPTSARREVVGATYIQRGLYDAWKEFETIEDVKVPEGNTQAGTQRTPVMILMSDGRPTLATEDYNNVGLRDSEHGNGSENTTTDETVFLTQLTAAWVKGAVSDHYGTDMKFYSLGMGTGNDRYATNVLYPSGTTNSDILEWWSNFQTGTNQNGRVLVENNQGNNNDWYLTYDADGFATSVGRNYIDRYWSASDVSGMISAFQEIVEEIGLQTAYSATLVESGEADLDGYITVEDELGAMMEVKDVKGILLGDTLFTGAEMARSLTTMGTYDSPTDYGNQFVRTVKERIGTADTSETQQLIGDAYTAGQLSYTSDTVYSNYIGWYGGENNNYLGFWQESDGYEGVGAPDGAKYINKSYGYLGRSSAESDADMMHIVVMVRIEIATGHQTVLFKVPSSLIPMVTYKVEVEGTDIAGANKLTVEETNPIRLLYEVGLPDDVNNVNLEQKVAEFEAKTGTQILQEDGSYVFYANSWDDNNDGVAPVISNLTSEQKQALTASAPESHFVPNTANERFYIQEDSVVYVKSGDSYVPATSQPAAGGDYYFARTIVNVTGANGAAQAVTQYEQLYPATVANADNFKQNEDGDWVVKAGTIRQTLSGLELGKTLNATDTIINSDHLWVDITGSTAADHNVYSFLGNNGKLTVAPATGIKVTKDVTELADGAEADEKFVITVTLSQAEEGAVVTDAEGNALPAGTWTTADNKVFVLNLADGETAYITGLTAGTTYTVAEAANENYTASYTGAAGTVEANKVKEAVVTNEPIKDGNLYITKEVVHAHEGETFPTDYEFEFEVTFVDADGQPIANTTFQLENNYDTTLTELDTDADGVMRGRLRHGETVYIKDIPAGATVTVEEVNLPADGNYTLTGYRSRNQSGATADTDGIVTIVPGQNATVVVTNTYTPKETSVNLDLTVEKILRVDTQPTVDMHFGFVVEKWNGTSWERVTGYKGLGWFASQIKPGEDNVTSAEIFTDSLGTFTEAGVYTYQIYEVYPDEPIAGMTYDRTIYTLTVTVTDDDGQLVAVVTDMNNNTVTDTDDDGNLEYKASFTNEAHTAPVSIDIVKDVEDTSKNPLTSKAGFEFVAVQTDENWAPLTGDDTATLTVYSDGQGQARLTATYKEAGSYYFLVSEVTPDPKPTNWTYSDKEYKVEVVVTKDETTGDLSATLIIDGADQNSDNASITFENTYDPDDAQVDLDVVPTVVKKLDGRELKEGEFTFAIFEDGKAVFENGMIQNLDDAVATGTNLANGNVNFTEALVFAEVGTYHYDVVEVKGDKGGVSYDPTIYDLVVEVTDNGDGTLKATHYFEDAVDEQVTFNNTYTAEPAKAQIDGLKTIDVKSGAKTLAAGDFTFGLYEVIDGVEAATALQTATNLANGTFAFEEITYTTEGTYTYKIREIAPDGTTDGSCKAQGMTYSAQVFEVKVTVTDNGTGVLTAEVTGDGPNTVHFVNTYEALSTSASFTGIKTLEGRDLQEGEFRFVLYKSDATFTERTQIVQQNGQDYVTNAADGSFSVSTGTLSALGYHYYVLKEMIPEERATGIGYDATEYHITVQVVDLGRGQMTTLTSVYHPGDPSAVNPAIAFKNTYAPEDGQITIAGEKIYNGGKALTAGEFTFALYEGTSELDTAAVAADGTFAFDAITYTAEDIGKTFTYTVKEVIPADATDNGNGTKTKGNIIYDAAEFTVVVTVADDNKDGKLEITKTVNGSTATELAFTNTFVPDPVDVHVKIVKKVENLSEPGITPEGFEFRIQLGEQSATDVSNEEGVAGFTINLTAEDIGQTYEFKISEKKGYKAGVTYDDTVHTVTVVIAQNAKDGSLEVTMNGEKTNLVEVEFTNTYEKPAVPVTGDSFQLFLIVGLLVVSAAAIVLLLVFKKKSNKGKFSA